MNNQHIERIVRHARSIASILKNEDEAIPLIEEVEAILDAVPNAEFHGAWQLPKFGTVSSAEVLGAIKSAFGKDCKAKGILQYSEATARAISLESALGTVLWEKTCRDYPPELLSLISDQEPFSPERMGASERGESAKSCAPVPLRAFIGSAYCSVIFLTIIAAATGRRDSLEAVIPLFKLMLIEKIIPIGFNNGGRTVLVPTKNE
ncbi:MAG: hypothetical protein V1738_06990 [Patescibacteria group bacterium]